MAESPEEAQWRENHAKQPFVKPGQTYEQYAAAYRTAHEGFKQNPGKSYEEMEEDLALNYEKHRPGTALPWDSVRPAVKAEWDRLGGVISPRDVDRGLRTGM